MNEPTSNVPDEQHRALVHGLGLVDLGNRTQIEFTGSDRASFLHNLCTNQVRDLSVGSGCESFLLNAKGHIVGHGFVYASEKSHVLETTPAQAEKLLAHFDRYLIREDVQLFDRSHEWGELYFAGPNADSVLESLFAENPLPKLQARLSHAAANLAEDVVWIRRIDLTGPDGYLMACRQNSLSNVRQAVLGAGATVCDQRALETARIEHGAPFYGHDISESNLPQEVDRNGFAISFTKGCYLGQETVARIDALGHVNRLLRGVQFLGQEIPTAGVALRAEIHEQNVGEVTSACWSPRLQAPLALCYLKRGFHEPSTRLASEMGPAEVIELPLASDQPVR